jgi:hypothetical protein
MTNPVLTELQNLSPSAKSALMQAHQQSSQPAQPPSLLAGQQAPHLPGAMSTGAPSGPPPTSATLAPPSSSPQMPALGQTSAPSVKSGMPTFIAPPGEMPKLPAPSTPPAQYTGPGSLLSDEAKRQQLLEKGSGIHQIQNPFLRGLAETGNVIGHLAAPGLMRAIPGTEEHHQNLLADNAREIGQSQKIQGADLTLQGKQLENREANDRANNLEDPPEKWESVAGFMGPNGEPMERNPVTGIYRPAPGANGATPIEKPLAPNVHVLPDGKVISVSTDPKSGKHSAEVVYEGQPGLKTEVKQLEIGGKPHQVLVNSQTGEQIKDLGATGEKPTTVNVNAGIAGLDRETKQFGGAHQKAVDSANAQLEKIADARAMINGNAEAQGLGIPKVLTALVGGQGTGVRITQAELTSIAHARGLQGDIEGTLNKWAGKGALSREQQQQLTQILDDVKARIMQKQAIHSDALDTINGASTREQIIQADKDARKKIGDLESGGGGAVSGQGEYSKTATGKNGEHYGLKDGKWYDVSTGKPVH